MSTVDPDALATCLRVLAHAAGHPDDPELSAVRAAAKQVYRAGMKARKAERRAEQREHDRALIATARRFAEEVPPTAPLDVAPSEAIADEPQRRLRAGRRCYVCKVHYRIADADYHMLCSACADENRVRRHARVDLRGRRAIVTGGRVKIGFHTALKLLRDGASVLVTTRFPTDAARRYAAVPDAADWLDRLWVHGVDFLDLPGVFGLVDVVRERWGALDILVNNAAQTIHRPIAYHRDALRAEGEPVLGAAAAIRRTGGVVTGQLALPAGADLPQSIVDTLVGAFPVGQRDETGEQLDLRERNSWTSTVGDVSPAEWLQTHVINAFVPFLLTGQLRPMLAASSRPDRYVVQVSAMEGSFSRANKTSRHPHTNMAKAALNMLTRTVAEDYAADGIFMSSVDTGWVTDERPHPSKVYEREAGFRPPLDVIDGAARVYDPIVRGIGGEPAVGVFLKDYRPVDW